MKLPIECKFALLSMLLASSATAFDASLSNVSGKRIIDLGCREGNNTRKLARAGARMSGADLSKNMVAHTITEEQKSH
ncbi:methyltransferase domain-containing protein [Pseudovibrio sp. Ad26]|uniref:methyltransferase domain-containing protein n=1 Tax=Pseudovibrio sp. Ad26 TaxID=989410 RepID=UPI0007AEDF28|nr:methyltransferase domain-containing protein [Pseudovibrio sp. Ad26]KZK96887.1 Mg-protoporphyrin IX methyl transferase [Pseudovibrio sp. Ad26]